MLNLRTRRKLLEQVKTQVRLRLGPMPAPLRRYAKAMAQEFRGNWRPEREGDFRVALTQAQVILGADFHAYAQAQRAHVRLLRDQISDRPVILALECLSSAHEKWAERFLRGEISEAQFLQKVEWEKSWGFPWEHYRPLFELARDRGFRVMGLNRPKLSRLERRDAWAAEHLTKAHRQNPNALIYVIIGEWHLAQNHLPRRLKSSLKQKGQVVVVFQDVESLYFKSILSPRSPEVFRGSGERFCLMVSPPWMKWQSYLMYLEHSYDRDLQDEVAIDYTDHVVFLVELIEKDLKLETGKARIQVYSPHSQTSLAKLERSLSPRFKRALRYQVEHDLSFFLPERDWLYLSRPTINHASSLAGQFVHAHLAKRQRALWKGHQDFLPLVWVEAVGFFFSKWINPKRKSETLDSIRLQLAGRVPKDRGRKALLLALEQRLSEVLWMQTGRLRKNRFHPSQGEAYIEAARILGSMLGERLFQRVRSRQITLAQLLSFLKTDVEDRDFHNFYWQLIKELETTA